jgi:hypothetical protein
MGEFTRHGYIWVPSRRELLKTAGGVLAAGILAPRVAHATITAGNHVAQSMGGNGGTTPAIDTTGASLLVVGTCSDTGPTVSDSKSNTWYTSQAGGVQFTYAKNPTVGSGHTVTISSGAYVTCFFAAFNIVDTNPLDQGPFGGNGSSPCNIGITPTVDNELIVTAVRNGTGGAPSVDSGFTLLNALAFVSGTSYAGGLAYYVQGAHAAKTVNWSWTGGGSCNYYIASFKAGTAASRHRVVVTTGGE